LEDQVRQQPSPPADRIAPHRLADDQHPVWHAAAVLVANSRKPPRGMRPSGVKAGGRFDVMTF
jgi:hypothetical protein